MHVSRPSPSKALVGLLAIAAGATVASLYYCQPVLGTLAREFGASEHSVSGLVTATQLGYAASLLLVVPLGDMFERRKLILLTVAASTLLLVAVGFSPSLQYMLIASFALGAASVTPQLVVPYAAGLVGSERRGRTVGIVMSGLLVGILLSRSISGFVAAVAGWRVVYWSSAVLILALGITLRWYLPKQASERQLNSGYLGLLGSLWQLLRSEPILRRHTLIGACGFAAFSAFWTTLAFHLASLPAHYGSKTAGLFGILGAAGALVAPLAGRMADRHDPRLVNAAGLIAVAAAFLLMGVLGTHMFVLILGVILMDAGVQGSHISNQTRIFALSGALRNRVNSVYMVGYFIGGAAGSVLGADSWARAGWKGVCWSAAAVSVAGLAPLLWPRSRKNPASCPS